MLEKFLKKFNGNLDSMLKHGTVAALTMFGVLILFGIDNIMLAFPIALTSVILSRQNIQVKTFNKIIKIIVLDIFIVIMAFIASNTFFISIPLNLIFIFLIMYVLITPYDFKFYKPFLMLYIFSQYMIIPLNELYIRILSIIFGVFSVVIIERLIKRIDHKKLLESNIIIALNIILEQLNNIKKNNFSDELYEKCTKVTRELTYKIYVTRYKKYLTTNLGEVQFDILLSIEYLNIYLKNLNIKYLKKEISKEYIHYISTGIKNIIFMLKGEVPLEDFNNSINKHIKILKIYEEDSYNKEVISIFNELKLNINKLQELNRKNINKIYKELERTERDKFKIVFKEYFKKDTIRFKFAARMSLTLTITLLISKYLGLYKIIWMIITIMSIMQPYYEDTIEKTKDRIKGNLFAILFLSVLFNVVNSKVLMIFILIISLYLVFAFKQYSKISTFTAMVSLSIASLTSSVNDIAAYRIIYVLIGVIVVRLVNKYLFPYKINNGINQLIEKINRYTCDFINEIRIYKEKYNNENIIKDLVIHIILLNNKLYIRNSQTESLKVKNFIKEKDELVITLAYRTLRNIEK